MCTRMIITNDPTSEESTPPQDSTKTTDGSPEHRDSIHAIACITCSTRKVKCDRVDPSCSNCIRSNITCEYRAPLPRGPRKRKYPPEEDLHARLERYEELLRLCGIADPSHATVEKTTLPVRDNAGMHRRLPKIDGKIVTSERGKPRYIENKLWDSVAEELPHDEGDEEGDEGEEEHDQDPLANGYTPGTNTASRTPASFSGALIFGKYPSATPTGGMIDPKSEYLTNDQMTTLMDAFKSNIDPLTKLIHMPTFMPKYEEVLADPAHSARKWDALIFCMIYAAAMSMSERDCQDLLYIDRASLLHSLKDTASRALIRADILRSDDIEVLQGFTFYLLAVRETTDLRTMWMLSGNAIRIAMGMGLHRGGSFESHFTCFQVEYRHRLWWQIAMVDSRVGELAGFGAPPVAIESDAKSPGNYNDADLQPDMKELPPQRTGATEMIFVHARNGFREYGRSKGLGPLFMGLSRVEISLPERERRIREMEVMWENNVLRYCDPLEPLHVLVSTAVRGIVHRLRLKAYHPMYNKSMDDAEVLSQKEENTCFNSGLKALEYDNHIFGSKSLEGFFWHCRAHFQWDALIYILSELKRRGHNAETTKVWRAMETCFTNHPEFIEETWKPLHLAVCNLCLKAWSARETAQAAVSPTGQCTPAPPFIERIREKMATKMAAKRRNTMSPAQSNDSPEDITSAMTGVPVGMPPMINQPDFAELANASLDPNFFEQGTWGTQMDWSLWNENLNFGEPTLAGLPWKS